MRQSALRRAARADFGKLALGDTLDAQATKLAERFEAAFWCEDLGTYALALDPARCPPVCCPRPASAELALL